MADSVFCVFCNDCGEPIEGEPPIADDPAQRPPCPKCGSTSRDINLPGAMGIITMAGSTGTLTITPLEDTLLVKAQELITKGDKDDFRIAVVVAHMACEISAERAILRAFATKGIEYLEENFSNFNLANDRLCNLYNAVTGSQIHKEPFWGTFKKSVTRRNKVVHKGMPVTKTEAEASYKAASDLVAYLR
jgi:hypothetical protein